MVQVGAFAIRIGPLPANQAWPRPRWRGKCHASGRRSGLGGAANTPGSYRQGEPQSAWNNQMRRALYSARL